MKKFLIVSFIVLSLAALTVAQQPKTYLVSRNEAVKALNANSPALPLLEFTEGQETRGMVALQIDGEVSAEKIRDALILSLGLVFPQPEPEACSQTSRGEACTGDARGARR